MYEDDFFFKKVNLISKISQQKGALNHFFFKVKDQLNQKNGSFLNPGYVNISQETTYFFFNKEGKR